MAIENPPEGEAGYRPLLVPVRSLFPEVTAPVRVPGSLYKSGLRKPILVGQDGSDSSTAAPQDGAARLVPPKPTQSPMPPQARAEQYWE